MGLWSTSAQNKAAVSVVMWLLEIFSKTCLCHSSPRGYLLLPSQVSIFAFLIIKWNGDLEGYIHVAQILYCLGNQTKFQPLDLSENLSCFSWNTLKHIQDFEWAKGNISWYTLQQMELTDSFWILDMSAEVSLCHRDPWANSVKLPLPPVEICPKLNLKTPENCGPYSMFGWKMNCLGSCHICVPGIVVWDCKRCLLLASVPSEISQWLNFHWPQWEQI